MSWIAVLVGILIALAGAVSVFAVAIGLPGTWMLIALAVLVELLDHLWLPAESATTFHGWVLVACVLLALLGELFEFFSGALGAKHGGGSRRGMVFAVIGGVVGGILGVPFGLVLGAFVGATIGTFAGAVIGELCVPGTRFQDTLGPATGASIGRVLGTLAKLPVAVAVWITLTVAAIVP